MSGGWGGGRVNKSLIDGVFDKGVGRIRVVGESKKGGRVRGKGRG